MIVGYAFVVADLFHYGHLHFLQECKGYCDYLIVGVYTDELVESYKRKPIFPFPERFEIVNMLKIVDKVIIVHDRSCVPALKMLERAGHHVNYLFHGTDWSPENDKDLMESKIYIEGIGGKLVQPEYYRGRTTTGTIEEILRREKDGENPIGYQK